MDLVSAVSIMSDPWQFAAGFAAATAFFGGGKAVLKRTSAKAIVAPAKAHTIISTYQHTYTEFDRQVTALEEDYEKITHDFSVTFPYLTLEEYCPNEALLELRRVANRALIAIDTIKNTHLTKPQLEALIPPLAKLSDDENWTNNVRKSLTSFRNKLTGNMELVSMLTQAEENYQNRMKNILERRNEAFTKFSPAYLADLNPFITLVEEKEYAALQDYRGKLSFIKDVNSGPKAHVSKLCTQLDYALGLLDDELDTIFDYSILVRKEYSKHSRLQLDRREPRNHGEKAAHKKALSSVVESEMASYDVFDPEERYQEIIKPYRQYLIQWDRVGKVDIKKDCA